MNQTTTLNSSDRVRVHLWPGQLKLTVSVASRLKKTQATLRGSRNLVREDDESIDELAGEALLKNVPRQHTRATSLHNELTLKESTRIQSDASTKMMTEDLDKPLPPIPGVDLTASRNREARPALASKTTNMKVQTNGDAQVIKPKFSPPLPQTTISSVVNEVSRPATSQSVKTLPALQSTTTDPVDLNRKISYLMQQASVQEAESRRRAALLAEVSGKPSTLERGKKAFVKATRALKDRLSNGSSNEKMGAGSVTLVSSPSSTGEHQPFGTELHERNHKGRLDRRKAEGINLSNPKIRSLMGDGNVPRKPLPVYESMRSRVHQSPSLEDPFSDGNEARGIMAPQNFSKFEFNFDKHKQKRRTAGVEANDHSHRLAGQLEQHSAMSQQESRFSNMISGLAQHSDTTYFSSSPVSHSTPYERLAPRPPAATSKRLCGIPRSPSILEFSFEAHSDGEQSIAPSTVSKTITDGSQSIKRKSGVENLRSPTAPAAKKPRVSSRLSRDETANLAVGLSNLDTEDDNTPLSPKDKTAGKQLQPLKQASKGKGLAIFDVGKGKEKETRKEEPPPAKKQRPKGFVKRSSFSRPSSMIFGRESRAGNRKFAKMGDEMDVDELA